MEKPNQLAVFEQKQIRSTEHEGQMWFSVIDIIEALTDSPNPSNYWNMLKKREPQLYTICVKLKFLAADNKMRPTDCANTEGVLRLIQSVPSPKAEPFKMWLANLGKKAIEEEANPELSLEHLQELYKSRGYTDEWITHRLKSIGVRKELTKEWQKRGVKEGQEYGILTATIAKETFGLTPNEHSQHKGLEKQNLRDHMTTLELIFTMLGEEVTRNFAVKDDAQGFHENQSVAQKGGAAAGQARIRLEEVTGEKVLSTANFLPKESDKKEELGE